MTEKLKNQTKLSEVYESLIENTPTHLAYFDRDFTFLRVNSAYANGSGHTKDELVGRNHFELFPNEEYQRLFEQVRDTGQSIEFKAKPFKFTDQPWRGVTYRDWTLVPVKNDTGEVQGLVFSLTDVTEQERTRLSLEETINERERIEQVLQTISNKDSGSPIYTSISCAPIRNACGKISGAVATYSDMTNRKLAELNLWTKQEELTVANEALQAQQEELIALNEELRAQQEELFTTYLELQHQAVKLEATLSSIAAGAIIYDHSGNISRINEYARCLFGYNSRDYNRFYPERWARLNFCKSDGTRYEPDEIPLFRALQGEIIRDEEMIFTRNSESPAWISGTMAPIYDHEKFLIGVIFIFTDITERKRQVEDLLASERELLKVILNSLGEGVVAADREERIILINEAAANLTGYFGAEAIGAPLHKIFYVFDDKTSEPIDVNNPSLKYKNPILVTRDLREVPIAMNSSPIKAMDGRNIGTVTVFADISEKQKTERELLKAEKLESLGILAGGIAHDFNNVLAAILSNIQLAILKLAKNEDINRYLWNTMEIARKASELTKQLLTFSKGGTPVKKDASLIELIRDTTEFVLRGARAKAEFAIPDNLWPASIDEGQISQVIHNLVINAKQAMPKGGIILIEAENVVVKEDTRYNPGNYVKITVTDQGIGIAKENLSKIFDPYYTTKKDGNGLGLATSYSIIIQHNGYIEVETLEGLGTSFTIHLPASDTVAVPIETREEVAAAGSGLKILLMDDEEKILNTVGEILECYGYQVVLTTDGTEAIELYKEAKRLGEPFDVVIMDLTIPGGMGGQEAIAYLRDFDPGIKAIVSSGYSNDPIMSDYERFGFIGVVGKPYKIDELNEVLQKVLNR